MGIKIGCLVLVFCVVPVTILGQLQNYFTGPTNETAPNIWALLVAGSNGYDNYRHQADICHAYQILHKHGVPDERIVVMMYDDIANNEQNPKKGKVFNRPGGKDVYHGVLKDYTQDDVTPENFLKILQGDSKGMKGIGSGKVIKSGPNDYVFVNFADHGAPGIIAFPEGELEATALNKAIQSMAKKNQFKKMVFYVEACESGSMFAKLLPKNINVFATTAANGEESSYACYWDDTLGAYLGDVYSVKWMEDSDTENLNKETLQKQFIIVKNETNTSHVQEFGDRTISKMHVGQFQGSKGGRANFKYEPIPLDPVPSGEVPIVTLQRKMALANSEAQRIELQEQLDKLIQYRDYMQKEVESIVRKCVYTNQQVQTVMRDRSELNDFGCYQTAVHYFSKNCYPLSKNPYALRLLYVFVNLCEYGVKPEVMRKAMNQVCNRPIMIGVK